jgi:hypothetical protein
MTNKLKFKIGDIIVRNDKKPDWSYCFNSRGKYAMPGDIYEVTACRLQDGHNGPDNLYSVKGAYIQTANWTGMEEAFDLYKVDNWKDKLER